MNIEQQHIPPFTVSARAINLIAEISALIERFAIRLEQEDALRLRKINRIKTIHSSLAIEGNTLSESEVYDIVEGKNVVAPIREIQEVKNAIKTYEMYGSLDAFKEKDLLKAHQTMMQGLVDRAGRYRTSGVGVFGEQGCVHLAPPADRVPLLMSQLFHWLKTSKDHLLIRSCVFHYEFEFIHPFVDGNGRMGRLWQSLILGKISPVFEHLPVENMVYSNQQKYYDAIAASSKNGESGPFIDFMLDEIYQTLKAHRGKELSQERKNDVAIKFTDRQINMLNIIKQSVVVNVAVNTTCLSQKFNLNRKTIQRDLSVLRSAGLIQWIGSAKNGHWEIVKQGE